MRVLHIGKFYPPFAGGIEYFLADLLPALSTQGVTTAALVHELTTPGQAVPFKTRQPETIYRAPCYGRLLYAPVSPAFPRTLSRALADFKPDLLHLHLPNTSAFFALGLPAARRLPWVAHWHSDVVSSHIDRRLAVAYAAYRPFEQWLLARSARVIATSPAYLATSAALRSWQDKCAVVPLGIEPARIPEPTAAACQAAEPLWHNAPLRVLSVGRLTYYKGHDVLIRAAASVPAAQVLIVGKGEQQARLQGLITELGVQERVRLLGFQSEAQLHALLAGCDVVCLPSLERTEAFGLVLLEAMRFQKAVLASAIPGSGVGWVVTQAGHGLLTAPGDPVALATALQQLAADPPRRTAFGQAGAAALQQIFHIEQVAKRLRALYAGIVPDCP